MKKQLGEDQEVGEDQELEEDQKVGEDQELEEDQEVGEDQEEEQQKEMIMMKMKIQSLGMEMTLLITRMMRMVPIILLNL